MASLVAEHRLWGARASVLVAHGLSSCGTQLPWSMQIAWYMNYIPIKLLFKTQTQGFPDGSGVKNLPANTRDTSSIPEPGRSHLPRSDSARAPQLLSLCSRVREPQLSNPVHPRACALQQEESTRRPISQLESKPCPLQLEKSSHSNKDPAQTKINK